MMEDSILKESIQFIETHLTEPLSLPLIAGTAGYSEYHYSRLFHKKMQCSVMEYVRKRRLFKASEEIMRGRKIVDVAYEFHWQSQSGFTRAFKAEYGCSPSFLRGLHFVLTEGGKKMRHFTLKNNSEATPKEQLLEILKQTFLENETSYDKRLCECMYDICCKAYDGRKRYSGSEYVTHPLQVAVLLADMGAEQTVVYAGMFCDVCRKVEEEKITMLLKELPSDVQSLVRAVSLCRDVTEEKNEKVVLIKLAERLHNMRTIEYVDENSRRRRAQETFGMFLPIARKFGFDKLASELNDLTVKYI